MNARGWSLPAAGLLAALVLATAATGVPSNAGPPAQVPHVGAVEPAAEATTLRNAIVLVVDDMGDFACADAAEFLPRSSAWLSERGTCYERATTATPVCCPARAQIQTGELPHNNGVRSQASARAFHGRDTVQFDLSRAGIRTYGTGKNLSGVNVADYYGPGAIETGFDDFDFWSSFASAPGSFSLYDDRGRRYRPTDGLTSTETTGRFLAQRLDAHLAAGDRFFLYGAFFAPHKQGTGMGTADLPEPSPAHAEDPVPPFEWLAEPDAKDKMARFAYPPRQPRSYYEELWAARIRSMYDVDDQVAALFGRLEQAGALQETAVIFVSDNGYADRGQSNWEGKSTPYPSSTDIPMLAYLPGEQPGVSTAPVGLIDVAPTVYDVLGVEPEHVVDGRSLLSAQRREDEFFEFAKDDSDIAIGESGVAASRLPSWAMVKHDGAAYVEFYRPDRSLLRREYYAGDDPEMTRNLLYRGDQHPSPAPDILRDLQDRLRRYAACAGTAETGSLRPCP